MADSARPSRLTGQVSTFPHLERLVLRVHPTQRHEKGVLLMNHTFGWMNGGMGGGMWVWTVITVLVVVLLVVVINKVSRDK
jgi:hypothetical protein